ncbi:MAG: hydantoinase/oxoprolinase family protein, partial [Pseudomonadota bacterium]
AYRAAAAAPATRRSAYFGPRWGRGEAEVIDRAGLSDAPRPGPLIVEEYEGTTIVPPDGTAALDGRGNIVLRLSRAEGAS